MPNFYEEALQTGYRRLDTPPPGAPPKPPGASNIYLQDPRTGTGFWLTEGVTDKGDGIVEADFDFEQGKAWAQATQGD